MATALSLLLSALVAIAVLVVIARPFGSEEPPEEFPPSFEQYAVPPKQGYLHAIDPNQANMHGPACFDPDAENERFRVQFALGPGTDVDGLPARGGLYMLSDVTGVELDFLGLDRFHNTERPSGVKAGSPDEEAHCDRLRQLGARWWPYWHDYLVWASKDYDDDRPYVKVGWPSGGGVWVLSTTYREALLKGVAIIHNAYNMEERCKVLEQLGAVFYENPKDCPDLDLP